MSTGDCIWRPDPRHANASAMARFMREQGHADYAALHQWSIDAPEHFWPALARFCGVQFAAYPREILQEPHGMASARWFGGARLSYAEHLLRYKGERAALIFRGEDGSRRELSYKELRGAVAACAEGLRRAGIRQGDRVAGYLPNCPEAIIAMLASASIGAVWTSCSPDFGAAAVIDRFGQTGPRLLFCADGYVYKGKRFDSMPAVQEILAGVPTLETVIVCPFLADSDTDVGREEGVLAWDDFCVPDAPLDFVATDFSAPLFILYSSGTTGKPKCIVHGTGGTLLQHLKEHVLHTNLTPQDRILYVTTCGWMMWNWLASALATGATLVFYDGAPLHEYGNILWRIAEEERLTVFGTSARYLAEVEKSGVRPRDRYELPALRAVLSTGSPLAPSGFDFVYDAIADDIHLASISGGTDIIGCFALGNPMLPVYRGEIQCAGLGMAVDVYDAQGRPAGQEPGELVCTRAFPSMPVGFWNDPEGRSYRGAYFEKFPGVWAHGDIARFTANGGLVISGRADAVLNPGGVRIGTAEIYAVVNRIPGVRDSVAVGLRDGGEESIALGVVLEKGHVLDETLEQRIRDRLRHDASPRHVPAHIFGIEDVPRTRSGKTAEVSARLAINGEPVTNLDSLANPETLEPFRSFGKSLSLSREPLR